MICLKEKKIYAKNMKTKKNQNAFNMEHVSKRCGSYMVYLEGYSPYQIVIIVCEFI